MEELDDLLGLELERTDEEEEEGAVEDEEEDGLDEDDEAEEDDDWGIDEEELDDSSLEEDLITCEKRDGLIERLIPPWPDKSTLKLGLELFPGTMIPALE